MLEPRAVAVGMTTSDRVEVRTGLAPGDTVVASATFLVDAESNLGSALGGMGDMPGMDMAAPTPRDQPTSRPAVPVQPTAPAPPATRPDSPVRPPAGQPGAQPGPPPRMPAAKPEAAMPALDHTGHEE
jgi:Cu(I)/Ag(I) efflux system membrane fusion protein